MNICYAATRNYYQYLPTVINSVLVNNPDVRNVVVFAEDDEIECLQHSKIHIVNIHNYPKFVFESSPNHDPRFSDMIFCKTICSWILQSIDKCLFLDVDTMVDGSIKELYDTDLTDYAYAMVAETVQYSPVKGQNYYNAGMMLMNLKMIREEQYADLMLWNLNTFKYSYPEQDVINYNTALYDKVLPVSSKWNYVFSAPWHDSPVIKHYSGVHKQWMPEVLDGLWEKYYVEVLTNKEVE